MPGLFRLTAQDGRQPPCWQSRATRYALVIELSHLLNKQLAETKQPSSELNPTVAPIVASAAGIDQSSNTTRFGDDASTVVGTRPVRSSLLRELTDSVYQGGSTSIADFLMKPQVLSQGVFSTSDTTSGNLYSSRQPSGFLATTAGAYLANLQLFKADLVFRLNVNAVRFTQGRYILGFLPTGGAGAAGVGYFEALHFANLMTRSQLPHVEVDLATQTSVELRLPWSSITTHAVTTTDLNTTLGSVFLCTYSPLVSGSGPNTVSYTLYMYLDNVQVSGPTYQSGFKASKKSVIDKEKEEGKIGPISGALTKISNAAGILSEVPLLSSIAAPTSWFTNVLARAAVALGFSSPLIVSPSMRMVRHAVPYASNADGACGAMPMTLESTNEVALYSGVGGTELDEMSIDFIKQQYAWFGTLSWTNAQVSGTILSNLVCSPFTVFNNTNSYGYFTFPPVTFLSRQFRYWRGGMKFRFKFVKTEFHSGRIMFAFAPHNGKSLGNLTPDYTRTHFLQREIFDIREVSEVEICTPYVSQDMYQMCDNTYIPGQLYVFVVDQLAAPSSVSSSISIIMEIAGAKDMEFAAPIGEDWDVFLPPTSQSGYSVFPCTELKANDNDSSIACLISIGERATSVRQILKRMNYQLPNDSTGALPNATPGTFLQIYPYLTYAVGLDALNKAVKGWYHCDSISRWSPCFAYSSGSMRLWIAPKDSTSTTKVYHAFCDVLTVDNPGYTDVSRYVGGNPSTSCHFQPINFNTDGGAWLQTGAYSRNAARFNGSQIITFQTVQSQGQQTVKQGTNWLTISIRPQEFLTSTVSGTAESFTWYRSAGDDYNLSFWCGTVPLVPFTYNP